MAQAQKPQPEEFGFEQKQTVDGVDGRWTVEGGEEAYWKAVWVYEQQQAKLLEKEMEEDSK